MKWGMDKILQIWSQTIWYGSNVSPSSKWYSSSHEDFDRLSLFGPPVSFFFFFFEWRWLVLWRLFLQATLLFRKGVSNLPPTSRGMALESLGSPNPFLTLTASPVTLQDKVHLRIYSSLHFLVICNIQVKSLSWVLGPFCLGQSSWKEHQGTLSTAIATALFLFLITVKVSKNTVMFRNRKAVLKCMVRSNKLLVQSQK